MKKIALSIFITLTNLCFSQSVSDYGKFKHFEIHTNIDTINYHIYSQNNITNNTKILFFIHGSAAVPMFDIKKMAKLYRLFLQYLLN